nr:pirin-like C-terminal cupin domain-containing protein [Spongiibacter thalassae]
MRVSLKANGSTCLILSGIEALGAFVLEGAVTINGTPIAANELAVMGDSERSLEICCTTESELLVLGGHEIRDELVRYGPFVANSAAEMQQTIERFQKGLFGEL